jgi:hypothetical protein
MHIKLFTKQEVEKVYKAIEQTMNELLDTKEEEAEHIEGIIILGFRDDKTFSVTNVGRINYGQLREACFQMIMYFSDRAQQEKLPNAE